jgi:hypothetical protein
MLAVVVVSNLKLGVCSRSNHKPAA